jgi:hypothetical protein
MDKLCLCGCGQTFQSERNRLFYSKECQKKYREKSIDKKIETRLCKCGCGKTFTISNKQQSKIYFSQSCCQRTSEYNRKIRTGIFSELYRSDMEVIRSQAKLKGMIKATLRVFMFDAEPDERSWIEKKYPCWERGQV